MLTDSERFAFTAHRIHAFETTGNAYDATQTDEAIETGDTLLVHAEGVVAVAMTWPFAITTAHGHLHSMAPLKDGDLFQHSYIGGGGYGDPIERSADLVRRDLDVGKVSERLARNLYRVAFECEDGEYRVDDAGTAAARKAERERRLSESVPAEEWFEGQRKRVVDAEFCDEVSAMYRDSMELSQRWRDEFAEFWKIDGLLAWEESK